MKDLAGKVALVTGAGSGIGRATALELAARGMHVAVSDIDAKSAEATAREARERGVRALGAACDVSDRAEVGRMAATVAEALGPVRLLFANAGVTSFEALAEVSDADLDWIVTVNYYGVFNCIRAVLPGMIAAQDGHIAATASMAGLVPNWVSLHVPYVASKAGIIGLMFNLREELADHGVGTTVLCPGGVATNILATPTYRPARFGGPEDRVIEKPAAAKSLDMGIAYARRTPEEVARMTVEAVVANRPIVVTDGRMRSLFDQYAATVRQAFDEADLFDRAAATAA